MSHDEGETATPASHKPGEKGFLARMTSRLSWEDALLVIMVLALILVNLSRISPLQQLPSPIYGGDYYYHLGYMNHLREGGSIFENSQLKGESPWAPFLYQGAVALLSKVTGADLINTVIYSSLLIVAFAMILVYWAASRFFSSKLAGLIMISLYTMGFPVFKYTDVTLVLLMPLFFFMTYFAMTRKTWGWYIAAGLMYGIIGISHTVSFMCATIFLGALILYELVLRHLSFGRAHSKGLARLKSMLRIERHGLAHSFKKDLLPLAAMVLIGALIAQLYWFAPIFKFHLETPNTISEYDSVSISDVGLVKSSFRALKESFFNLNFSSIKSIPFSMMQLSFLAFLIILLLLKKRHPRNQYLLIVFASYLVARFHFIITLPLMNREFFSGMSHTWFMYFLMIASVAGLALFISSKIKGENAKTISLLILIAVIIVSMQFAKTASLEADPFYQSGKTPLPSFMQEVRSWISNNAGVDDVVMSTNEVSFMLNALTGVKVVNARRAHSGMWVDVDRRWADAAVIYYGNNTELRKELLRKYGVKYVYWQYNWISLDFRIGQEGQLQGWFDPLLVRDMDGYAEYLSSNGVNYTKVKTWLDPANKGSDVRQFDALLVWPKRWDETNPWDDGFTALLRPEKDFYEGGQVAARIYSLKLD